MPHAFFEVKCDTWHTVVQPTVCSINEKMPSKTEEPRLAVLWYSGTTLTQFLVTTTLQPEYIQHGSEERMKLVQGEILPVTLELSHTFFLNGLPWPVPEVEMATGGC